MSSSLQSGLGILVFLGIAWILSEDRTRTPWWTLFSGLVLQFALAATLLWLPPFKHVFMGLNDALLSLEQATRAGTSFVSDDSTNNDVLATFGSLNPRTINFGSTGQLAIELSNRLPDEDKTE